MVELFIFPSYMTERSNGVIKKHERRMEKMEGILEGLLEADLNDSQETFETDISQLDTVTKIIIYGWATSFFILILEFLCKIVCNKIKQK